MTQKVYLFFISLLMLVFTCFAHAASPSVTYTFSNSTTADATEVNTNFTDLINSMTDGTKTFSIDALTCAGTTTLNGNVTLGNATSDTITYTGLVGSDIRPATDSAYGLGDATYGWEDIYLDDAATMGGTIYFNGGTTEFVQCNAAGDTLTIASMGLTVSAGDLSLTEVGTTGDGALLDGSTITTGNVLRVEGDAATMDDSSGGSLISATIDATEVFRVTENGATTIAGSAEGTDALTLTAGDITLSDGDIDIAGGDLIVGAGDADITVTDTTGNGVYIDGSTITSGDVLQVEGDAATMSGGKLLNLTIDTTSKFTVAEDGATVIAGTAEGTDSLTLTAGDLRLTDGDIDLAGGELLIAGIAEGTDAVTVTAGDITLSDGDIDIAGGELLITGIAEGTDAITITAGDITLSDGDVDIAGGELIVAGTAEGTDAITVTGGDITLTDGDVVVSSGDINVAGVANIDATGVINFAGADTPGWVSNIGFTYSAGTFTVTGADGTALSATNPAWVTMQDEANPGRLKSYKITADQNFVDDAGSSEIIGNLFGSTTGIAWGNDKPFFVYACVNTDNSTIAMMLSDNPSATVAPAAGDIGDPGEAVADDNGDFFAFDIVTEADYAAKPCLNLGAIRMQMSASDDWTVQTLSEKDGVGHFHEATVFTFPTGQNGADASAYISSTGDTPVFTTNEYFYQINRAGKVYVIFKHNGDGGTDGSSADLVHLHLPYDIKRPSSLANYISSPAFISGSAGNAFFIPVINADGDNFVDFLDSGGSTLKNSQFGAGGRQLDGRFTYIAFNE